MKTIGRILRNILLLIFILLLVFVLMAFGLVCLGSANYPVKYGTEIQKAAQDHGIDPYYALAIVKAESDFQPEAKSKVGAKGLMQIMPKTADWLAEQKKISLSEEDLTDPEKNLDLGCYYLSYLIQHFQNRDLATAAYNGGLNQVDSWLKEGTITWERESLSNIPVSETREYLGKVNKNYEIYRIFYQDGIPEQSRSRGLLSLAWHNFLNTLRWFVNSVRN